MYYVYIISNWNFRVLYTGFTNDLDRRILEHKLKLNPGFSKNYKCYKLLYYEEWSSIEEGLHREKQIKRYRRKWKENLIKSQNPKWKDLFKYGGAPPSDPGTGPGILKEETRLNKST